MSPNREENARARQADPETVDTLCLINLAQAGKHSALERLFQRYYPSLQKMVRPMIGPGVRRSMDSGDVLQEALYEAIRDFDHFNIESRERFMGLMRKIVENRIRKVARHQKAEKRDRQKEVALRRLTDSVSSGELNYDVPSPEPSPGTMCVRREEMELFAACVRDLPERTRSLIRMREDGNTWKQIADRFDFTTEDAARMHHARAREDLRVALARRMGETPG